MKLTRHYRAGPTTCGVPTNASLIVNGEIIYSIRDVIWASGIPILSDYYFKMDKIING